MASDALAPLNDRVEGFRQVTFLSKVVGLKWKLIAGAASVSLLGVGFLLAVAQMDNRHLSKINDGLDARINDKNTGLVVQLAQAATNAATLKVSTERQTTELKARAAEDRTRLEAATAALAIAQRKTRVAEARAAILLSQPPRGDTLDARILDVDARLLEMLK